MKMKIKIALMATVLGFSLFLTGCATNCCGYGSYDYNSRCGLPSCTDQYYVDEYSNPCPGPYSCDVY